jgi:hypothetical protein
VGAFRVHRINTTPTILRKKFEEQLKMSYLAPDSEWFLTTLVETANS